MYQQVQGRGSFEKIELPCGSNLLPGTMVMENSSGQAIPHNSSGGFAERAFATEDALQGNTAANGYLASNPATSLPDPVSINIQRSGNLVQALLQPTHNYPGGTQLISNGDGTLIPTTGTPKQIIGVIPALFAINLSGSGAVITLNTIRVL